jgi:hypothetical protein
MAAVRRRLMAGSRDVTEGSCGLLRQLEDFRQLSNEGIAFTVHLTARYCLLVADSPEALPTFTQIRGPHKNTGPIKHQVRHSHLHVNKGASLFLSPS